MGYPKQPMPPHSLVLSFIGACLLWVGWFGFNAGSALASNGLASSAFVATHFGAAAAAIRLGPGGVDKEWKAKRPWGNFRGGGGTGGDYTGGGLRGADAGTGDRIHRRAVLLLDGHEI